MTPIQSQKHINQLNCKSTDWFPHYIDHLHEIVWKHLIRDLNWTILAQLIDLGCSKRDILVLLIILQQSSFVFSFRFWFCFCQIFLKYLPIILKSFCVTFCVLFQHSFKTCDLVSLSLWSWIFYYTFFWFSNIVILSMRMH